MIKDIIVTLDGSSRDETRLAYGDVLARRFGAHLNGLFINVLPNLTYAMAEAPMLTVASLQDEARAAGDKTAAVVGSRLEALGIPAELRRLHVFPEGVWSGAATYARTADLAIASQPYGSAMPSWYGQLVEGMLFDAGRALYVVPEATGRVRAPENILIAWGDTRESARAVSEAMPFLKQAKFVCIAMVEADGPSEAHGENPGADIARHLARHGIAVELRYLPAWDDVAQALLNEAARLDIDLLVMGAYGHSRTREWILGGVTRTLLTRCPIPLLTAH